MVTWIGAHVRNNLDYFICLRQLIRSRAVTNRMFFIRKELFHMCATYFVLPSDISTMVRYLMYPVAKKQKQCQANKHLDRILHICILKLFKSEVGCCLRSIAQHYKHTRYIKMDNTSWTNKKTCNR